MFFARISSSTCLLACTLCAVRAAVALAGQTSAAQAGGSVSTQPIPVEVFRDAKPKYIYMPHYPDEERADGGSGWVVVSLMVDAVGKPFEPAVIASTGDKAFEQLAVEAAGRSRYVPATLNGRPIDSATQIRFNCVNHSFTPGERRVFIEQYRRLEAAFKTRDRAAADVAMRKLQKLKIATLDEDTNYRLAVYKYAYQWGNTAQQLFAIRQVLFDESYLSRAQDRGALLSGVGLDLDAHDYGDALQIWKRLKKAGIDQMTAAKLDFVIRQLQQLRTNDVAYKVDGTLSDDGSWSLDLFKRHFQAIVATGGITDVKLRCSRGYVHFMFDPHLQYTVNGKYGGCRIELLGSPGTRFQLVQF